MPHDQVADSVLWGLFRLLELTELVRQDTAEVAFREAYVPFVVMMSAML